MLGESTAHRAYILEVDRNRSGTQQRVTLLVDYGRNQARVEFAVAPASAPILHRPTSWGLTATSLWNSLPR
jgi:hypothetical protein